MENHFHPGDDLGFLAADTLRIESFGLSGQLTVAKVQCLAEASGIGGEEPVASPRIVLPVRGLFMYHLGRTEYVAAPLAAFLLDPGDRCRVSHPADGGDECMVLVPGPELLGEVFAAERGSGGPFRFRVKRLECEPGTALGVACLGRWLEPGREQLPAEEAAMALLAALAAAEPDPVPERYAERARACLAAEPTRAHALGEIAREVRCSPFHLARLFRRATGSSLHQFLTRQRMALALRRLAEGEEDLARMALELGFSSHSHFSQRFLATFGIQPSVARLALTRKRLDDLSRILTARAPARDRS
jgi:AraC-like DNA-binding protein